MAGSRGGGGKRYVVTANLVGSWGGGQARQFGIADAAAGGGGGGAFSDRRLERCRTRASFPFLYMSKIIKTC